VCCFSAGGLHAARGGGAKPRRAGGPHVRGGTTQHRGPEPARPLLRTSGNQRQNKRLVQRAPADEGRGRIVGGT